VLLEIDAEGGVLEIVKVNNVLLLGVKVKQ
jgi:hypothetical protein